MWTHNQSVTELPNDVIMMDEWLLAFPRLTSPSWDNIVALAEVRALLNVLLYSLYLSGMGSRQFCRGRGRGQGREVEAEARQGEIDVICVVLISYHNAHVVVTCSCFVVSDIYQWKTLLRSFIEKSRLYQIPDRAKTVWGRGKAEPVKKLPRAEGRPT